MKAKPNEAETLLLTKPWAYDGYEEWPLICVKLPELTPKQVVDIIAWWDVQYGNTEQCVPEWATEFQLFVRNLVHDGALLVNPRQLAIDEVESELKDILTSNQWAVYFVARMMYKKETQKLISMAESQN